MKPFPETRCRTFPSLQKVFSVSYSVIIFSAKTALRFLHLSIASGRRAPCTGRTTPQGKSKCGTQTLYIRAAAPTHKGYPVGGRPCACAGRRFAPPQKRGSDDPPNRCRPIKARVLTSAFSSAVVAAILGAASHTRICLGESTDIRHHGEQRCSTGGLNRRRGLRRAGPTRPGELWPP